MNSLKGIVVLWYNSNRIELSHFYQACIKIELAGLFFFVFVTKDINFDTLLRVG
jgi:hypothetical protein